MVPLRSRDIHEFGTVKQDGETSRVNEGTGTPPGRGAMEEGKDGRSQTKYGRYARDFDQ